MNMAIEFRHHQAFRLLQLVAGNDLPKMLTLLPNGSSMTRSQRRYIVGGQACAR